MKLTSARSSSSRLFFFLSSRASTSWNKYKVVWWLQADSIDDGMCELALELKLGPTREPSWELQNPKRPRDASTERRQALSQPERFSKEPESNFCRYLLQKWIPQRHTFGGGCMHPPRPLTSRQGELGTGCLRPNFRNPEFLFSKFGISGIPNVQTLKL